MRPVAVVIGQHFAPREYIGNLRRLEPAWTFRVVRFPRRLLRRLDLIHRMRSPEATAKRRIAMFALLRSIADELGFEPDPGDLQ